MLTCLAGTRRRPQMADERMFSGQHEARDDLAVHVELAGWHEPEPFIERGWAAGLRHVAGQQLSRALGPDESRDLPDDLRAVAAALVPRV